MRKQEHFPADKEIVVTLKLLLDSVTIFIGRLVEISRDGLRFEYIVLREDLARHIDAVCEVSLKKNSGTAAFLESISCTIVDDELAPVRSPFGVPVRRCRIRFSEPLPHSIIQPFIETD